MNETEITQLLAKIFPPKPAPVASELPAEMANVVETAKELGLTWVPTIVIETEPAHKLGCLDFNQTYSEPTVRIFKTFEGIRTETRSNTQMARTLAHELGHCYHTQTEQATYETHGFKVCEDFADNFREQVLSRIQ